MRPEEYIPVNEPLFLGNEKKYLADCIETGWVSSEGAYVKRFEEQFAHYVDRDFGVSVSNGSVALDTAINALGIGPGDEIILPTFTIISCIAPIIRAGATPILVDCDAETWNMNIAQVASKITPKTKAILIVHIYGLPVDMDPILELAEKNGLLIIEDAAEMHGQDYNGKSCGSFGQISTFSFYPNKLITTGEGGMLVTDDKNIAEKCKSYRNLCFEPPRRFIHNELGWNFRLSNIQAALGLAQLEQIEQSIEKKRYIGKRYTELLQDIPVLQLPIPEMHYAKNIYWVYGIVINDDTGITADEIINQLGDNNIGSRPFFWPMHKQPVLNSMGLFIDESYPVAERLAEQGFYIPSGMAITDQQIESVAEVLHNLFL